jgi:hypothetical protein
VVRGVGHHSGREGRGLGGSADGGDMGRRMKHSMVNMALMLLLLLARLWRLLPITRMSVVLNWLLCPSGLQHTTAKIET